MVDGLLNRVVLPVLSLEGGGLVVAAVVALAGVALGVGTGMWIAGLPLIVVAVAMAAGSIRHLVFYAGVRRRHPPPGVRVDVGGFKLHVLAEGEGRGAPAIVWFGGAHAGGLSMHHLHRALREYTRSILIDRAGTGWSDAGPFPRSTALEADETVRALEAAGERGPFVWVGHSFGGLLAANIARRRPDLTHTVVLLDATPPETIAFGPRLGALSQMKRMTWGTALFMLFGRHERYGEAALKRARPEMARLIDETREVIGRAEAETQEAIESSPRPWFAAASIYEELSPRGIADRAWDLVVYDGMLGQLPVLLVAPGDAGEVKSLDEIVSADAREAARMQLFFAKSRERYLATSSRSRRIVTPPGTSHNFPYQTPDFVIDVVRGVVDEARAAAAA